MERKNDLKSWTRTIGGVTILLFLMIAGDFAVRSCKLRNADHDSGKLHASSSTVQTTTASPTSTEKPDESTVASATSDIPVLMYHHIKTNTDPNNKIEAGLDLPPEQFDLQMQALSTAGYKSQSLEQLFSATQSQKVVLTFDDGYRDIFENALPIMNKYGFVGTAFIITSYVGRDGYMTWDEIKALRDAGWQIGSHTVAHPDLTKVTETKLLSELNDSKDTLQKELGTTIDSFCYPSGKLNDSVVAAASSAGYKYATTTQSGITNSASTPLLLKRVRINGSQELKGFKSRVIK